jgi:hypothetical protein
MAWSNYMIFYRDVLASRAFRSLSKTAMLVYLDFLAKVRGKRMGNPKKFQMFNNGELTYYYSEALKRGITRPRFQRAIDELIEKGFIDLEHQGAGYNLGTGKRDMNLYAISERWKAWGTDGFVNKARPKDIRGGFGFKNNQAWEKRKIAKVSNNNVTWSSNKNVTWNKKARILKKTVIQAST